MKKLLEITFIAAISYSAGFVTGRLPPFTAVEWQPRIGDTVATTLQLDGRVGALRTVTITNVVRVGKRCQTGLLVYGDGLPGVDSSWVKPAP